MRKSTRLIALLMTLFMLVGTMPFSTFAVPSSDEGWYEDDETGDVFYNDPVNGPAVGLTVIEIEGVSYYFYFDEATHALKKDYWSEKYGMYFGADGKAANGMLENVVIGGQNNDRMYFVDGIPSACTVDEDGVRYIFGADGKLSSTIDLTAAEVVITIKMDGNPEEVKVKTTIGARFEYVVPTYLYYDVTVCDEDFNEIPAVDGVVTIVIDCVTGYTEYLVVYSPKNVVEHAWVARPDLGNSATCMNDGFEIWECSNCGKIDKRTVNKSEAPHVFNEFNEEYCEIDGCNHLTCGNWYKVTEETCTEAGIRYTYCTECHKAIDWETIEAAHDYDRNNPVAIIVTPICDEEGLAKYKCTRCDDTIVEAFDGNNDYHQSASLVDVLKPATCVSEGVNKMECTSCGGSWTAVAPIDPTAHNYILDVKIEDATCYTKQEKWSCHCEYCGAREEKAFDIDDAEKWVHDYDEGVLNPAPTCGDPGKKIYTCQNPACGDSYYETVPETGEHNSWDTCYDDTKHWKECSVCHDQKDEAEHFVTNWTEDVGNGTHSGACECGYSVNNQPHEYEEDGDGNKIFYGQDNDDTHWYKCSVCGAKIDEEAHVYDDKKSETHHWQECECGKVIGYAEHSYSIPKYNETHHWNECSCGANDPKTEHTFTPNFDANEHWEECTCECKINVEPHEYDEDLNGDRVYSTDSEKHWYDCTKCDHVEGEGDHNLVRKYNNDQHWYECDVCGYETEKIDHNITAITEAKEATCTQEGNSAGSKCADCGLVFDPVEYYGQLSHDIIDVRVSDAECHYYACRNCTTKINPESHVFPGDWTCNDKEHKRTCIVCNARDPLSAAHDYLGEEYYTNIDDEEGTATTSCEFCGHETQVEIETWYEKLGMTKVDGKYYYPVDGVNVTNKLVEFDNGVRFFGEGGALVLTANDPDGIDYITFQNARGVIDDAVITLAEGTYCFKQGVIQKSELVVIGIRYYYFNENGLMVKNELVDLDGDNTPDYWFNENGIGYELVLGEAYNG